MINEGHTHSGDGTVADAGLLFGILIPLGKISARRPLNMVSTISTTAYQSALSECSSSFNLVPRKSHWHPLFNSLWLGKGIGPFPQPSPSRSFICFFRFPGFGEPVAGLQSVEANMLRLLAARCACRTWEVAGSRSPLPQLGPPSCSGRHEGRVNGWRSSGVVVENYRLGGRGARLSDFTFLGLHRAAERTWRWLWPRVLCVVGLAMFYMAPWSWRTRAI